MQHIMTQPTSLGCFLKLEKPSVFFISTLLLSNIWKKRGIVSLFGSILQNETKKLVKI